MDWVKKQAAVIVSISVLAGSFVAGYSRLQTQAEVLCQRIEAKADREPLLRELDAMQRRLERIEAKIDSRHSENNPIAAGKL